MRGCEWLNHLFIFFLSVLAKAVLPLGIYEAGHRRQGFSQGAQRPLGGKEPSPPQHPPFKAGDAAERAALPGESAGAGPPEGGGHTELA